MMSINKLYSDKVLAHFKNPRNMGEMRDPTVEATVGNPICGDVMKMYVKITSKNQKLKKSKTQKIEYIEDIKFQTLGCGAAIATSSALTELAKGKTVEEAEKISKADIVKALDWLPPNKLHCSLLAEDALKKALAKYRKRILK